MPPLTPRQSSPNGILAIPTQYQGLNSGPQPGAVVGIVLGSVAGFLFLMWLLWVASNGTSFIRTTTLEEEDVVVATTRRKARSRRGTVTEKRASRSPRRERIVRTERIVRSSRPPPRDRTRERSRSRPAAVIVDYEPEPGRVAGDDMITVIEEHDSYTDIAPPPRGKSRGGSGYRRGQGTDL